MSTNFERKTASKWYWSLKMIVDIVLINFIFTLTSLLSLFVLFFPGLVALTTTINKMLSNEPYNPFTSFFEEIKLQWSFMWRLEVLGMSFLVLAGLIAYGYYAYFVNVGYDWMIWIAVIIASVFVLVAIIIFLHLLIFNEFFKDDTFWMMIRKASLIARKKIWMSFLFVLFLVSIGIVSFLIPYIIPFVTFSLLILVNLAISRKTYQQIALEEEERMLMPENLYLPQVKKDEDDKHE